MTVALRYAARSDIGLGRYTNNQDAGYAGPHLLAVCDGMGGHAAGDVASSVALGRLVELDGEHRAGEALEVLAATLRAANAELHERVLADPALAGMGTTTTALMLHDSKLALAHIGDSRCYLLRDGELTRLTHDHTFVQKLVDEGRITEDEADRHPQRSVITRVLTGDPDDEPDLSVREARLGDRYLVCSDGLTGVVRDQTLAEVLGELGDGQDPASAAETLVDLALRGGGADNITCVVAVVVDPAVDDTGTVPEVVGSAAVRGTVPTVAEPSTPAAKAAELERAAREPDPDHTSADDEPPLAPPASKRRWALRIVGTLAVVALLLGGGYAAYAWSQQQYYVGAAGGSVAIFRGLPQDIGPLRMSRVVERQDVTLASLPQYTAEQVRSAITVDGLPAARDKVAELRSEVCATAASTSTPTTTPTSTPTASPTTTPTPTPSPSPSAAGCGGTG